MDISKLLLDFSACTGVAGDESEALDFGAKLLSRYGKVRHTTLGSLLCEVRPAKEGQPHLLLDAHIDEIGMIVTYIEKDGFLRVAACGGVDRRLLLASLVTVHTKDGAVNGVVCSVPPHLQGEEEKKNKKADEIYIDIGYSKEEAEQRVRLGDRVTIQSQPGTLLGGLVCGKALDDRAGCVALLAAIEEIGDEPLSCGLSVLFSTQEEVGGQGAKTAAYLAAPTHAVAVDVSFGHTPDAEKEKCGVLGEGPMIGFAPVLDRHLSELLREIAKEKGIPYQTEVMGRKTGTNADGIAVSRGGVVTGLLSVPLRYMHTPIETVSAQDVENTGKLLAAYARILGR